MWIGIGAGISISRFLAMYLVSKVSEKSGIGPPLLPYQTLMARLH